MRHLRVLTAAAILSAAISHPSAAQSGRQFQNAWFWGATGGVAEYSSNAGTSGSLAPTVGIDWLITRSRGGLYVSLNQLFVSTEARFTTPGASGFVDPLTNVTNERRITVAGMVFPMQTSRMHPYFGLGMSVYKVTSTSYLTDFSSSAQFSLAEDSIQARKAAISPTLVAGLQLRQPRFSVFGQGVFSFLPQNYLLNCPCSSRGIRYALEGGIRYNIGSSIDQIR